MDFNAPSTTYGHVRAIGGQKKKGEEVRVRTAKELWRFKIESNA